MIPDLRSRLKAVAERASAPVRGRTARFSAWRGRCRTGWSR